MKKLLILMLLLLLCGCGAEAPPTTVPETTVPTVTTPPTTVPPTTSPLHSSLYLDDFAPEEVMMWFDEVVLQMEYSDGTGDPGLVQKWLCPLLYRIEGEPTDEDLQVLNAFLEKLNQVPGFPGIAMAEGVQRESLTLSFLGPEEFQDRFSEIIQGEAAWGAVQYWYYTDTNEIHTAHIGYRTDIPQSDRNSIILEEIVNALGITDTERRSDSIVYQHSNDNLELSQVDWLLLKLLYHPEMGCGMDADQCHTVIAQLYY